MPFIAPPHTTMAVIGLGYVGLPLAVEFAKVIPVIGYDINTQRIAELASGTDSTLEVEDQELASSSLSFTSDPADLKDCNVYVVTTPTPVDEHNNPDLGPLLSASRAIAPYLRPGDVVIYESTVYPGATEEDCVPILEEGSGLKFNQDFFVGYSPERINPGDKTHRFPTIKKVTSGSTPEVAEYVDALYRKVVTAGTYKAASIRVAEAAKVIENTQRDVNIALVNELALLFRRLGIDTNAVLEAAGTKWNFLPFRPGLVGGHCIGVDPYYLTYKAQAVGYHPELILAGRRLNDSMGAYVATELVKEMTRRGMAVLNSRVLVLGLTFKENTPDLRNTKVIDVVRELASYGVLVDVHDPWCDADQAKRYYDLDLVGEPQEGNYDAAIVAVGHEQFIARGPEWVRSLLTEQGLVYDVKRALPAGSADLAL
ncbi:MAG: nucleotide sugar dehydrogenase [Propionibacteriaceae bacterium]|nr:nucleotide sugar dehydrogenase [Propionibacteriaceae bacterium]